MTFRRRPILRTRQYPEVSQHYEVILDGAVRKYSDGREVCQDNASGWRLYKERVREMVQRQNFRCSLCGRRISVSTATFEHQRRRGAGGAWRDDRIVNSAGEEINSAAHWVCNSRRG
jgi:hypothetical protein